MIAIRVRRVILRLSRSKGDNPSNIAMVSKSARDCKSARVGSHHELRRDNKRGKTHYASRSNCLVANCPANGRLQWLLGELGTRGGRLFGVGFRVFAADFATVQR